VLGAPTPPERIKKVRRNSHGKFVSAPPGTARVNFMTFLLGGEDLEGGLPSSFSLCFQGDDAPCGSGVCFVSQNRPTPFPGWMS